MSSEGRLVVVSNRLPVVLGREGERLVAAEGSGGLVTALAPVLRRAGGTWIGWAGTAGTQQELREALEGATSGRGYALCPVALDERHVQGFYEGFANSIVWPLFHDQLATCHFEPSYWDDYREVNRRFADTLVRSTTPADPVWIHDYHLFHVGLEARARRPGQRLAFFLHIPFPSLDSFERLPWRGEVLHALLAYDTVGVQTRRDLRNLRRCLEVLAPEVELEDRPEGLVARAGGRETSFGVHPIGIDTAAWRREAASAQVTARVVRLQEELGRDQLVMVGVDRLDYTKGLLERLEAYRHLLREEPSLRGRVTLIQLVVPSREGVEGYQALKADLERLVGEIQGEFGTPGRAPIHYLYRSVSRPQLQALYRIARVCLVTSLKDGMNLVAKEFCACQDDEDPGVLVLSEFAGAADALADGALLVNPHDVAGTVQGLRRALRMSPRERAARMLLLQDEIGRHDVFWWVERFLARAFPSGRRVPRVTVDESEVTLA